MDDAVLKRTKEIFAMCDGDGDGVITKSELFKLVKELGYAIFLTNRALDNQYIEWKVGYENLADISSFVVRVLDSLEMTKAEVALLFSTLDVNNDGKLQFAEFVEGMKWLNRGMNVQTSRDKEAASSSSSTDRVSEMALQDALDSNRLLLKVRIEIFGQ